MSVIFSMIVFVPLFPQFFGGTSFLLISYYFGIIILNLRSECHLSGMLFWIIFLLITLKPVFESVSKVSTVRRISPFSSYVSTCPTCIDPLLFLIIEIINATLISLPINVGFGEPFEHRKKKSLSSI